MSTFYITTTLPYVNSDPHIGFAAEIVRADIIARYRRIFGDDVFFNTGTDEHGMKIFRKAEEEGISPQTYVDRFAAKFAQLGDLLNLSFNSFTRTTDEHHIKAAQEFWRRSKAKGDIYKKNYQVKYCVGCELEKNDSELENGCCPLHPNQKIELIDEENYFFAWSKYQDKLLKLYEENPEFVLPRHRLHEVKNFVESGLQDFSISRLKTKMPWGIPVPDDEEHVMYVWFDALINYISCLGWPDSASSFAEASADKKATSGTAQKEDNFKKFWPGLQVAGKDNLRQQSAMWQAMLMSADLPNSKQILIFGFIQSNGQKMSKSLGNVINPFDVVSKYGVDPARYYIAAGLQAYEDSDFTYENFEKKYNADLANGLGNLVARTVAMAEKYFLGRVPDAGKKAESFEFKKDWELYDSLMNEYKFGEAIEVAWGIIRTADSYIDKNKPWELAKAGDLENLANVIYNSLEMIRHIAWMIAPFIPETSDKILEQLGFDVLKEKEKKIAELRKWGGLPSEQEIKKGEVLFPRI